MHCNLRRLLAQFALAAILPTLGYADSGSCVKGKEVLLQYPASKAYREFLRIFVPRGLPQNSSVSSQFVGAQNGSADDFATMGFGVWFGGEGFVHDRECGLLALQRAAYDGSRFAARGTAEIYWQLTTEQNRPDFRSTLWKNIHEAIFWFGIAEGLGDQSAHDAVEHELTVGALRNNSPEAKQGWRDTYQEGMRSGIQIRTAVPAN